MYKTICLTFLLIFAGCYQVDELRPLTSITGQSAVETQTERVKCSINNNNGPFNTFGTLETNLGTFFSQYVKAPNGDDLPADLDYSSNLDYDSRVDYKKLFNERNSEENIKLRNSILGHISQISDESDRDQQVAELLNAYNFIAIDIIIQCSSQKGSLISSIMDLGPTRAMAFSNEESFGYQIFGERNSLDFIEKDRIAELTDYEDARIHFAVICASGGCPVLLHKPFTAELKEEQLDFITRAGLRLPRMFENKNGVTFLSKIFDWYLEDYIADVSLDTDYDSDEEYIEHFVKEYSPEGTTFNVDNIKFVKYDWTINKL